MSSADEWLRTAEEQSARALEEAADLRTVEDCFGLIGMNAGFFTGYDDMVRGAQENVGNAADYLSNAGERLAASAEQYGVVEIGIVDGFGQIEQALPKGNFGRVGPLDARTPTVDTAASAQKLGDSVGDFSHAQSLPAVFVAGVSVKRDVDQLLQHPMQGLWDNADEQQALATYWEGPAQAAHNRQKTEFQDGLRALADCCLQLKEHLNQVEDFFEGLWDILVDIVRELVESLIITWLAAHATSAISFGSSVAAAWSVTVARFSVTLSRILMQISKALQWLVRALQALKTQSLLVRTGARALGVHRALRFLDPTAMLVRGVTGLTGTTPGKTALNGNREAMDRGIS